MCDLGKMRWAVTGFASVRTISAERLNPFRAEVAQLVEHSPEKAGVDSSILSLGTITLQSPRLRRWCQQYR